MYCMDQCALSIPFSGNWQESDGKAGMEGWSRPWPQQLRISWCSWQRWAESKMQARIRVGDTNDFLSLIQMTVFTLQKYQLIKCHCFSMLNKLTLCAVGNRLSLCFPIKWSVKICCFVFQTNSTEAGNLKLKWNTGNTQQIEPGRCKMCCDRALVQHRDAAMVSPEVPVANQKCELLHLNDLLCFFLLLWHPVQVSWRKNSELSAD